ncbi:exosome complex exonuclease Rrp41 [Candidatus Woesearchaeota archaeon]|nr:exosome complex exonuclease Rrp41 [Candidatus Woesearchaeota archaeon]
MSYDKRFDGREFDGLRPIEAKAGVIPNADGSAYFKIGKTAAYAAVYGPRDLYPKFLKNPQSGVLRCRYNMLPFSGAGDRVRPGGNRRSKEISMIMDNALASVVDLSACPNSVVDVFVELPQTDAGSRCAAICAASMALADAGIPMKDLVAAVAVGRVDDKVVVDLEYAEEAYEDGPVADIPIAYIPSNDKISLLQMDGVISKDMLIEAIEKGKDACKRIIEIQKEALKAKYSEEGEQNE